MHFPKQPPTFHCDSSAPVLFHLPSSRKHSLSFACWQSIFVLWGFNLGIRPGRCSLGGARNHGADASTLLPIQIGANRRPETSCRGRFEKEWGTKSALLVLLSRGQMPRVCLAGITLNGAHCPRRHGSSGPRDTHKFHLWYFSSDGAKKIYHLSSSSVRGKKCFVCWFCHKYWQRAGEHILIKKQTKKHNFGQSLLWWILSLMHRKSFKIICELVASHWRGDGSSIRGHETILFGFNNV